jgi:hypothetical protein
MRSIGVGLLVLCACAPNAFDDLAGGRRSETQPDASAAGAHDARDDADRPPNDARDSGQPDWWLYTDLDSPAGAQGWISAVYVTVGGNYEPIPGLPDCLF